MKPEEKLQIRNSTAEFLIFTRQAGEDGNYSEFPHSYPEIPDNCRGWEDHNPQDGKEQP